MKINIYTIEKKSVDEFSKIIDNQKKMIQKYAQVNEIPCFSKKISSAQNRDAIMASSSYSEAFEPYLKGYNIALHPEGKEMDSFEFSEKLDISTSLNFFIAGAYGFEDSFLKRVDSVISLSKMTFSHKIAKVILFEQIYRGLTIIHKHPYHK